MDVPAPPLESPGTGPKPFVFVLMPFDDKFTDAYQLGIKEAAKEVGAYAERVDEQMYSEGILERIFNQIAKADVLVADMTGRNENVFYEVGYAHALDKVVVLLTQNADDIPFDLKHRPHLVYDGKATKLRAELPKWLSWAIVESRRRSQPAADARLSISWNRIDIPEISLGAPVPTFPFEVGAPGTVIDVAMQITNNGALASDPVSHLYLFVEDEAIASAFRYVQQMHSRSDDVTRLGLPWQFRLEEQLPAIPTGATEILQYALQITSMLKEPRTVRWCLRLHIAGRQLDFPFVLALSPSGGGLQQGGRRLVGKE